MSDDSWLDGRYSNEIRSMKDALVSGTMVAVTILFAVIPPALGALIGFKIGGPKFGQENAVPITMLIGLIIGIGFTIGMLAELLEED
jgi:hypothetical protein